MTLLAVALSERSCDRLRGALLSEAALGRADLVELRLDGLDDPASADLPRLLRRPRPPVILTERHGPGGPAGRLERLRRGAELGAEWVDLDPGEVAAFGRPGGAGRIASLHDPAGRDLAQLHRTLVESGAEVAKLAVTTSDAADAAALLRVAADAAHPTIA
ncbi:MAG: type I 3-dehydroquinate dehydratase [Planctomycetes bacterium]|nr:type I 3-dehydroquinate dehydratase [Planctomycetota bacterium]